MTETLHVIPTCHGHEVVVDRGYASETVDLYIDRHKIELTPEEAWALASGLRKAVANQKVQP